MGMPVPEEARRSMPSSAPSFLVIFPIGAARVKNRNRRLRSRNAGTSKVTALYAELSECRADRFWRPARLEHYDSPAKDGRLSCNDGSRMSGADIPGKPKW